jgi:hypothetical protein
MCLVPKASHLPRFLGKVLAIGNLLSKKSENDMTDSFFGEWAKSKKLSCFLS